MDLVPVLSEEIAGESFKNKTHKYFSYVNNGYILITYLLTYIYDKDEIEINKKNLSLSFVS